MIFLKTKPELCPTCFSSWLADWPDRVECLDCGTIAIWHPANQKWEIRPLAMVVRIEEAERKLNNDLRNDPEPGDWI